ncbi:ABC transporter permease [candidate division KSB1 bacterium]|nr:ABC transporter permease [candidate division KSB1 bacterium]
MLKNYLKITLRNLRKHKVYAFINILGLAIGITCCLLILLYVQDELYYDRFHHRSDRIYRLVISGRARGEARVLSTAQSPSPWGPILAQDNPGVENYVRFKTPLSRWLISIPNTEKRFYEKRFYFADATVFDVFDYELLRGDTREALKRPNAVVLTESSAKKYFGAEDPIGKILTADNNYEFTVTGVMRDATQSSHLRFDFLASFATLTVPGNARGDFLYGANLDDMAIFGLTPLVYTYLLFRPNYTPEQFEQTTPTFLQKYLGSQLQRLGLELNPILQPLASIHLHSHLDAEVLANSDINTIYIFFAISGFILLIACINFMNLATARSANRAKEVGLRKVVGSDRGALIKQFLGESTFLALIATFIAIAFLQILLPWFNETAGKQLSIHWGNGVFLATLLAIVLIVGLVAGSYPAFFLSAFQPAVVLKGQLKLGTAGANLRRVLVVAQFAASIIFIIGTVVVYRQLQYVQNQNLGFDKEHVLVIPVVDPPARFQFPSFKNVLQQNPGILSVSAASSVPSGLFGVSLLHPEGMAENENISMETMFVEHDFIPTLGIAIAAGRNFSCDYSTDSTDAFIINEAAAAQLGWKNGAVGKTLDWAGQRRGRVIGVVQDFHVKSLHQKIEPLAIHLAYSMDPFINFVVRLSPQNIPEKLAFLEEKWRQVYPLHPFEYSFLDEDFDHLYRAEQLRGKIFSAFAGLAIFIACLGLFGLAAFSAEQRTKEIGIRKILGAAEGQIVFLLSKEFVVLVLLANLVAWPIAYWAMHNWLQDFAYRTSLQWDIFIFGGIVALMISLLTVSFQAIKAALANPVEALRYE